MTELLSEHQRRTLLAAEFALGLLDRAERAEALRLIAQDREFAAEVARWQSMIEASLAEDMRDVTPPMEIWNRVAAGAGVAPDIARTRPGSRRVSPMWRITALAASLAAVVFASLWLTAGRHAALAPPTRTVAAPLTNLSVAQIRSDGDERLLAVVYDRRTGQLVARLAPFDRKGGMPELWLIGADGKPRSLGTSGSGGEIRITLPAKTRRLFADGATIAISLEPMDQLSHDAPKGTILGSAKISAI